jgi:hypothetical protein
MTTNPSDLPPCGPNFRPRGSDPFSRSSDEACVIQQGGESGHVVEGGILRTGPHTGQRIGLGAWNETGRYQCLPRQIGLPNADLVRIQEGLLHVEPGDPQAIVNGRVTTPGNACFDMGDPQQVLGLVTQCSGTFWGVSDFCRGLFSGGNAQERAEAFLAAYRAGYARYPLPRGDGEGTVPLPEPILEAAWAFAAEHLPATVASLVGSVLGLIGVAYAFYRVHIAGAVWSARNAPMIQEITRRAYEQWDQIRRRGPGGGDDDGPTPPMLGDGGQVRVTSDSDASEEVADSERADVAAAVPIAATLSILGSPFLAVAWGLSQVMEPAHAIAIAAAPPAIVLGGAAMAGPLGLPSLAPAAAAAGAVATVTWASSNRPEADMRANPSGRFQY